MPHLSKDFNVVVFSKPEDDFINGEIISKNCTKADAIERVMDYYHANMEDTIAFGDSMNDAAMLRTAGHSVVVGNAPAEVQVLADEVTLPVQEDGVAYWIENFLHSNS